MSNVNQLEMKLHKLADRIGKLESEVKELKNEYSTRKENVHGKTDS
jgi:FtsZ-binding cell division protein ZapB